MDNRIHTKNAGRKPLTVLYSSDSNRPPPGPIGKGAHIIKESSRAKPTYIFCDDQDENASVSAELSLQEKNKPMFYVGDKKKEDADDDENSESEDSRIVPLCDEGSDASEDEMPKGSRFPENSIYESSSIDMESIIADQTKSSFVYVDDKNETDPNDSIEDEINKSTNSVLCVSMKSAVTGSCDWASELSDRQARRDIVLSCPDYAEDIQVYLRSMEKQYRPKPHYMRKQPDIGVEMRTILVDWLVDVANEYDLCQETLHLAVQYTDRFLSIMAVRKEHFQLLGVASMMIAALVPFPSPADSTINGKYEEIYPPDLQAFVYITDDTYNKREMMQMEQIILKALDFNLSSPTAFIFLISYLKKSRAGQRCQNLAKYLCDLALMEYSFLPHLPSLIAASSTFLAHYVTDGILQAVAVQKFSGYSVAEIYPCAQALLTLLKQSGANPQQAIRDKYKGDKYCRVSLLEPPESLPPSDAL